MDQAEYVVKEESIESEEFWKDNLEGELITSQPMCTHNEESDGIDECQIIAEVGEIIEKKLDSSEELVRSFTSETRIRPNQKKRRARRTKPAQYVMLLEYMTKHFAFAVGKFLGKEGKAAHDRRWATLCSALNAVEGGAQKSVKQWQTVWRDLKSNVSIKVSKRRRARNQTGSNALEIPRLTPLELKVAAIVAGEYMEAANIPDCNPQPGLLQSRLEQKDQTCQHPAEAIQAIEKNQHPLPIVIIRQIDDANKHISMQDNIMFNCDEGTSSESLNIPPTTPVAEHSSEHGQNAHVSAVPIHSESLCVPPGTQVAGYLTEHGQSAHDTAVPFSEPTGLAERRTSQRVTEEATGQRIGVQREAPQINFSALFEQQTECLKMIAETAKLQAEVAMKQAEASQVHAEALRMQAENERKRLDVFSRLAAVLPRSSGFENVDTLRQCSQLDMQHTSK